MTDISARYRRQNDRTDVAHLFMFIKIIKNKEHAILTILYYDIWLVIGWNLVKGGSGSKLEIASLQNGYAYIGKPYWLQW